MKRRAVLTPILGIWIAALLAAAGTAGAKVSCTEHNTFYAHVVAIDQPIAINRLGATQPGGMVFALARDVCAGTTTSTDEQTVCDPTPTGQPPTKITPTNALLKPYKRPRPIVLRVNQGHCLKIGFTNLLSGSTTGGQTATTAASVHVQGMELTRAIPGTCQGQTNGATCNDGSWVGQNPSGLVPPAAALDLATPQVIYQTYAAQEGAFLLYSTGDNFGKTGNGGGNGGQLAMGLFGAVHVEPADAKWYRSQVTAADLALASKTKGTSKYLQPLMDYAATYPEPPLGSDCFETGACRTGPVLRLTCSAKDAGKAYNRCQKNEIVHSDLTAIIAGPTGGRFPTKRPEAPTMQSSYSLPDRLQPFREFTIIYHEMFNVQQAFADYYNIQNSQTGNLVTTGNGEGQDQFGINYGMAGIGSEVLANRLGVGPMANCTTCKFEEFFLTSWAVGDPAMVVDIPADPVTSGGVDKNCQIAGVCQVGGQTCNTNGGSECTSTCDTTTKLCSDGKTACTQTSDCQTCLLTKYTCQPTTATMAFYPDDPSNVYHSYISDHTKFRILHGGSDLHHVHHQHAHQWLHSPDTSNGDYLDSQSIGPGSAFTLEMTYNASGNVNQTVGDSIFHCHFYPHFAGGMWSLWRTHDVYETGTLLNEDGTPQTGINRALPDGEIAAGTPIPALVPVPTIPMPPMPALVQLASDAATGSTVVEVCDSTSTSTQCNNPVSALSTAASGSQYTNPGFPFFIPGLAGQRAPHPPLDFAYACSDDPGQTCTPKIGKTPANLSSCKNPATARCEEQLDGGLPRHMILACKEGPNKCTENASLADYTDFSKTLTEVQAFELPEGGTFVEQVAMKAHGRRLHPSVTPENSTLTHNAWLHPPVKRQADFVLNGLPPVAGAPFADPCIKYTLDGGRPSWHDIRHYKAVDIQLDVSFNKEGWHFPQQRILSLWGDVADYLKGKRAPEPFFFRANSGDCIEYVLANLVPNVYELDDFQVRTPTDVIGQHIHLVKFDVTSSDGATNGFNYEDGTLGPNEVTERIVAINATKGLWPDATLTGDQETLTAKVLPFFGPGPGGQWMGAQATIQRWYTDRLFDGTIQKPRVDRTLRTVFTHDHFGPSTHQQAGLYAGLVIEPEDSQWFYNDTQLGSSPFGGDKGHHPIPSKSVPGYAGTTTRDGGPTTWQAVIVPESDPNSSFREFLFEFQDTTLTYEKFGTDITSPALSQGFCQDDPTVSCTPSTAQNFDLPNTSCKTGPCIGNGFCSTNLTQACKPGTATNPEDVSMCPGYDPNGCSEYASVCPTCNFIAGVPSSNVTNTSNPPFVPVSTWSTTALDAGKSIELITLSNGSYSFSVNYRNEPLFLRIDDDQGTPKTGQGGKEGDLSYAYSSTVHGDPFTPLLQAYAGDDVQVRTLVGAHINPHNFTIYGVKWLEEPSFVDSGWRNSQEMGISEHFEEVFRLPAVTGAGDSDYLYMAGAAAIEQAAGSWGLLRAYAEPRPGLTIRALHQNQQPKTAPVCPSGAPARNYTVAAYTAKQAFSNKQLVYNARGTAVMGDPNAILYFDTATLSCSNPKDPSTCSLPIACNNPSDCAAPLVLRANAGDCMNVTLYNMIQEPLGTGVSSPPNNNDYCGSGATQCTSKTSPYVGLHPQLVSYDVTKGDGFNAGNNPDQVVASGSSKTYQWYAGNIEPKAGAGKQHIPIEFGAANLLPSDTLNHYQYGLFGALVIEPEGSTCDGQSIETCTGTTALIRHSDHSFREFVLITRDGLQGPPGPTKTNPFTFQPAALGGDKVNTINYSFEPLNANGITRTCLSSSGQPTKDLSCVLSNNSAQCCDGVSNNACTFGTCGEPQTPIFQACAGEQVRFRVLHAGGINTNQVFELHGHSWQEQPYVSHLKGCQTPTTQTNLHSSSKIGVTNGCNPFERDTYSEYQGARMGHGPSNHFDVLIEHAGGIDRVPGDYLYRTYPAEHFRLGLWGVFRVNDCGGAQGAQGAGTAAGGGGR